MSRRSALVLNGLVFVLGLALSGALLELGLRLAKPEFIPRDSKKIYESDPKYGWLYQAGKTMQGLSPFHDDVFPLSFNQQGFRESEFANIIESASQKILFVGDSITAGIQVPAEQRFSEQLARSLSANTGQAFQSVNLGVNGFATDQSLMVLTDHIQQFRPVAVVYTFVVNDLHPNDQSILKIHDTLFGKPRYQDGVYVPPPFSKKMIGTSPADPIKRWLRRHSALYTLLTILKDQLGNTQDTLDVYDLFVDGAVEAKYWDMLRAYLMAMKQLSDDAGAVFVVGINPPAIQVNAAIKQKYERLRSASFDPNINYRRLQSLCEELGIVFAAYSTEALLAHEASHGAIHWVKGDVLYDGHFTKSGHQFFAGTLEAALKPALIRE